MLEADMQQVCSLAGDCGAIGCIGHTAQTDNEDNHASKTQVLDMKGATGQCSPAFLLGANV